MVEKRKRQQQVPPRAVRLSLVEVADSKLSRAAFKSSWHKELVLESCYFTDNCSQLLVLSSGGGA